MKVAKVLFVALLLTMFLLPGLVPTAEAVVVFRTATVVKTGPGGSGTYMQLANASFTPSGVKWFFASASKQKEMLATSLVALANAMALEISYDDAQATPAIQTMYLKEVAP